MALNIGVGYVLASFTGIGFYFVTGDGQWRGITGLQMLFPCLLLAAMYWLPESPRYLVSKDRPEEALAILKRLHASTSRSDHFAEVEYYQICKQIEVDSTHKMSYMEIFKHPTMRKRAFITMCLTWCMLGSGVLVINSEFDCGFSPSPTPCIELTDGTPARLRYGHLRPDGLR
jgi:hypothetical protein